MLTRARPRVRRKFTRLPCGGKTVWGAHGSQLTPARPHLGPRPHLAHVLHDDVEPLVQDHTQQTHQVPMLHLPGGPQVWGEGPAGIPGPRTPSHPETHVMTAVSSRKAWAVTSHLMFFTATFCPRYSP